MMVEFFGIALIYGLFLLLISKRIMFYLPVMQKGEYSNARLRRWIFKHKAFDKRLSAVLLILSIIYFAIPDFPIFLITFGVCVSVILTIYFEKDPRDHPNQKLLATNRDKRLVYFSFAAMAALATWCWWFDAPQNMMPWPWIVIIQIVPSIMRQVNNLMKPFENALIKANWTEAKRKINEYNPTIIGISGSYDKTVVKYVLAHILASEEKVLMVPDAIRTLSATSEFLKENLEKDHVYLVMEMSSLEPGYITALCQLAPPDYGIVSSTGKAHMDYIDSLEAVTQANFELVHAIMTGEKTRRKIVLPERILKFATARSYRSSYRDNISVCGMMQEDGAGGASDLNYLEPNDVKIIRNNQTQQGLEIRFWREGKMYNLSPPIVGTHHSYAIMLASLMALEMGFEVGQVQLAMQRLTAVPNIKEEKL